MDEFTYWRETLAGKKLPVHADHPQSGYYRQRVAKNGPWLPVAIWTHKDTGLQVARVAGEMIDPLSVWTWVADKPVGKAAAQQAFKDGTWPGDAAPVSAKQMGDNNPPSEPVELIPLEIAAADAFLTQVGTITTQVDSDIASNKVSNLRDLTKQADAAHSTEKAPHLAASRAVDEKYRCRDAAAVAIKKLLAAVTVFQNTERARLQKIADDKAAKERIEWERQQAEVRKIADASAAKGAPLEETETTLATVPPPPKADTVKVKSGGALGKGVSLRTYKVATIADYDKALVALKDHPEMRELVQKLADRACKAGVPLAGVTFSEEQRSA